MAINVSSWSIRNPIPAILLFVMLTLIGLVGFRGMKIQQFPDIDLPTVSVVAGPPALPTDSAWTRTGGLPARAAQVSMAWHASPTRRPPPTSSSCVQWSAGMAPGENRKATLRGPRPARCSSRW